MIIIRMIQIYGESTMKPLQMTFKSSIEIIKFFQEKGDKLKNLKKLQTYFVTCGFWINI